MECNNSTIITIRVEQKYERSYGKTERTDAGKQIQRVKITNLQWRDIFSSIGIDCD